MIQFIPIAHAGVISDAPSISSIGMNVLNFLLSVVGIIAIISLLVSGAIYFFSFGDQRKMSLAKKSVQYSVLGIVLALGGMVLIRMIGQFFQ